MTHRLSLGLGSALALGLCLGATGCSPRPPAAPPPPVSVPVSYPVEQYVTDHSDFTGQIAAVDSVDVKAHVWGYLKKVNFKEGDLVKKDDVLFELDPGPYQALVDQAQAKVRQDEAQLKVDEAEYRRDVAAGYEAVSRSDVDKALAARDVDAANVAADKAVVASNELNLKYTKVTAPVSGRVSRYFVTVGNLIQSGDQNGGTLLTTIVSVDPMYAYYDVDERTVQRVRQFAREGKVASADATAVPVSLGLETEEGFPHQGAIDFLDNQVNPKTGTLRVRGVFPNKDESLSQGYFARVRMPIGTPHPALLVNDRALTNDQGQKVLYVVNDKNEVVSRPVRVGALHDGLREVADGLKPGERVIVNGLLQVRPGVTVEPKLVDMPTPEVTKPNGAPAVAKATPCESYNTAPQSFRGGRTMSRLEGKVALVTGASKGIGAGIAKGLAAAGASVAVNYASDRGGAEAVVAAITASGGRAVAVLGDVSRSADVGRLFAETKAAYGAPDVLVNNAAVYQSGPLEAMTEEEFHREFNTNVLGPLLMIREAVKYFGPRGGSIINIGSVASHLTPPNFSIYSATKGALDAITRVLAKELGPRQIRVNSINPGATATEGARAAGVIGVGSDSEKQMIAMTPLGRIGQPSDIAPTAVFLASDESGWVTGEIICASGGWR